MKIIIYRFCRLLYVEFVGTFVIVILTVGICVGTGTADGNGVPNISELSLPGVHKHWKFVPPHNAVTCSITPAFCVQVITLKFKSEPHLALVPLGPCI